MGAVHWNSNLLCVIDIETSGKDPTRHDILQIAVLPLKANLKPDTDIGAFYMDMQPVKPEKYIEADAMNCNKLDWHHLRDTAMDPWKVSELFDEWWQGLKLPFRKTIIPIAHNWPFESGFLHDWLGAAAMQDFFFQFRDTMALANSINDMADMRNEAYPFPKTGLGYMCSQLKIENHKPHDALADCMATAELYRRLVTEYTITL